MNNKFYKGAFLEFNLTVIFVHIEGKLIERTQFCAKHRDDIINLKADTIIAHPVDLPLNNITTEHLE